MSTSIEDLSFLVTGGASGLGAGVVEKLHAQGANVVICDLNEDLGNKLVEKLGNKVVFSNCNVASEEDAQKAVDLCVKTFGSVHGLVNCAGIGFASKVVNKFGPHKLSIFEKVIKVNLIGSFNMLRIVAQQMSKQQPYTKDGERGVIVNVASVAAFVFNNFSRQIGQAAYSASKGGIVSMTIPIARELARYGIRICTVAPGLFETPMSAMIPKKVKEGLEKEIPFPSRFGSSEEFASLCHTIITNPYLNGETIRLDGAIRMSAM